MPLQPGTPAPDFTLKSLTDDGFVDVTLSKEIGAENVVLLFFPGAFTSVCTEEFCDVSAGLGDFLGLNAKVFGISVDNAFSQHGWAKAKDIAVPLLSDFKREVVQKYDVVIPDFAGLGLTASRAVVIIDRNGIIRYVQETPGPGDLPDFEAVKRALAELA